MARIAGTITSLAGLLLPVAVGLFVAQGWLGDPLARLSYDLPFLVREPVSPPEAVLVYLDEESARVLGQRTNEPWDRTLHTQLLERLRRDGARLVYYDIVFLSPWDDPQVDDDFAAAIQAHGRVVLGASYDQVVQGTTLTNAVFPPTEPMRSAAAGWGLLSFKWDPDFAVRELTGSLEGTPGASVVAAQLLDPKLLPPPQAGEAGAPWLNYYGPSGTLRSVSFHQALQPDGVPPEFFRDKLVFIGGRPQTSGISLGRDQFANPWSRWGDLFSTGLEVHATEFLNLHRHEALRRMEAWREALLLTLTGLAIGAAACWLSWGRGGAIILTVALLAAGLGFWFFQLGTWYTWLVPLVVQAPAGLIWSTGSQYLQEARRRATLRRAFSLYLSGHMADRVAESDFDLTPGGKLVDASVMFTDCQGFTAIAEELGDPLKVSELLIAYFTEASRCVLANEGTILKYIGDAVMAVWGAPLREEDHAFKAACAAWELSERSKVAVLGRVLKTRVGLSTGPMAAGNLGSAFRFDYTVIGDAVNLASRLEGLNKVLGTTLLTSEATRERLGARFHARCLGHFATAGKKQGIAVYELLGPVSATSKEVPWLASFEQALQCIRHGHCAEAETLFRDVIWQRGGQDGPSEFYLRHLHALAQSGELATWTGVVRLSEK